jgi:23S rRNA pseudouridine1911/1915/1917 synthase
MTNSTVRLSLQIPDSAAGQRLDQALATLLPDYSRSRLQKWIEAGEVRVAGETRRPRDKVFGGETVEVNATLPEEGRARPQPMPLAIVYEDAHVLVLDKPAGLVVHPGAGNPDSTLQNALLAHDPRLAVLPRAGIVHRLDKDTSGLLIVARTLPAHTALVRMLEQREVHREYQAVCRGVMTAGGTVDAPIDRHPTDRVRMSIREGGREAVTHYRVIQRFRAHTHVRVQLETGRTHQIRVHLAHIGYPLVGDKVYGGRLALPKGASEELRQALRDFPRQALHAARLELAHPVTGRPLEVSSPLPEDMARLLAQLAADAAAAGAGA